MTRNRFDKETGMAETGIERNRYNQKTNPAFELGVHRFTWVYIIFNYCSKYRFWDIVGAHPNCDGCNGGIMIIWKSYGVPQ